MPAQEIDIVQVAKECRIDYTRLYFIVRTFLLSGLFNVLFYLGVFFLGEVNVIEAFILGTTVFFISLFTTGRIASKQIDKITVAISNGMCLNKNLNPLARFITRNF